MSQPNEEQLTRSWLANAGAWTAAVREQRIESRRLATDAAILSAVTERSPRRVLDAGCGEGWLCRALAAEGTEAVGIDASEPLVRSARGLGGGTFHVCSYEALAADPLTFGRFDAAVLNFALLAEDVGDLLIALHRLLAPAGVLFIQTVHPWTACGDEPYRDGWRTETFASFGGAFAEPMPWFFRTLTSWIAALRRAGFQVDEVREPVHPESERPLSLLLTCTL